ncbi:MAG TPA: FRG domain-containing protein [Pyrinomonadaceae bacterium]|nr:FRG domain-containing protein [Pyrinomonadaceae bacterium]
MTQDKIVKKWQELVDTLYAIPRGKHDRHRSDFVYRGVANKDWGLETSLRRLGPACGDVEGPLLRSFAKYAKPGEIPSDTLWFRLAVAQHHGLPTRLMDWSVSPRVAAHFATFEEEHYDKDGAIWCVDVVKARELLPRKLREILSEERAFLFSIEMLNKITLLRDFDAFAADGEFVLFFEPPSLDDRIINQGAIMSVMPGVQLDLKAFLERHADQDLFHRIIIPKELKWELRDKLDQDNVTERMLFPGLDGLSRWLKRYYGPGPNATAAVKKSLPAVR